MFADEIRNSDLSLENKKTMADIVISVCKKDNSRFDEDRFLKVCGFFS
jgi:hypothetical protein